MDLNVTLSVVGLTLAVLSLSATVLAWKPKASPDKRRRQLVIAVSALVGETSLLWLVFLLGVRSTGAPLLHTESEAVLARVAEASDLEMEAFRRPATFDTQRLSGVFLPPDQGGEVVQQIEGRVKFLRERHWHYGEGTRLLARGYPDIVVNGTTAFVRGVESWRLVLWDGKQNRAIGQRDLTNAQQVYQLVKVGRRWFVKWSNTPYKESSSE